MADEMIHEKVYCMPSHDNNTLLLAELMNAKNQGTDAATMSALFSRDRDQMNNPMWLVWMMAMRWMFGNGYGDNYGPNCGGYAALQNQISDNQNVNNMLREMTQNQNVMADIANRTNTNIDFVRNSICQLSSALQQVGGDLKFSSERIVNSVLSGESNIISKLQQCCCDNKLLVTQQGYETRLAMKDQTYTINERLTGIANGLQKGFSDLGYILAQQKGEIMLNQDRNTQRVLDQMCANSQQALRDALAAKDRELLAANIIAGVKKDGCGCSCGC